MTPVETAWFAGLMEGEGSFGNYSRRKSHVDIRVRLAMTDMDVIKKAADLLGGMPIYTYDRKHQGGYRAHHKTLHCITLMGYRAARAMEAILPFMGERRSAKITGLLAQWNAREARTRERGLEATCHPDKGHYCQGLCRLCYQRMRYPEIKDRENKRRRDKTVAVRAMVLCLDPTISGEWHP